VCKKIENRIECEICGYPLSKALYPDNYDNELPCNGKDVIYINHIKEINSLYDTVDKHPFDCKCLICR